MLQAAGFLKKHNKSYTCADEHYKLLAENRNDDTVAEVICRYLDNAHIVIAFLHYNLYDGVPIAPAIIYTDGIWVWPSYFSYYVKKHPNLDIPAELMSHILQNKFIVPEVSPEKRQYIQYLVMTKIINEKIASRIELPATLMKMIKAFGTEVKCY